MTDFQVKTAVTGRKIDSRWRASRHGYETAIPGQIDSTKFIEGTHMFDGIIPSGVALSKLASGLYGPFDPAAVAPAEGSVVDGYLNDQDGVDHSEFATISVLKHGDIATNYLPIVAQRDAVAGAPQTGLFTYQED